MLASSSVPTWVNFEKSAKKISTTIVFAGVAYLLFSLIVLQVGPSGDDWGIIETPDWFLGVGPVYRPFEYIFSWIVLKFPWSFPHFNHLVILVCHAVNTCLLYRVIQNFKVSPLVVLYASIYFLFAPAVMGGITSVDGTNQVVSTFYSLLGFFAYFRYRGFKRYVLWLALTMIAAMHKEIGITWFIGTPLLAYIINNSQEEDLFKIKNLRSGILSYVLGICFVVIYLVIRVNTSMSGMIGATDSKMYPNYTIGVGKNVLVNFSLLLGSSSTAFDTVAFFGYPRKMILVVSTILFSVPFLLLTLMQVYRKLAISRQPGLLLILFLFMIIVISPHLLMGRCGELHAYSMALPYTIFLAVIFDGIKASKTVVGITFLFGISIIMADVHKLYGAYLNGYNGLKIVSAINEKCKAIPKTVKVITIGHRDFHRSYSSFYQDEKLTYNSSLIKLHYSDRIEKVDNVMLSASDIRLADKIDSVVKKSAREDYQNVWIVDSTNVEIIDFRQK